MKKINKDKLPNNMSLLSINTNPINTKETIYSLHQISSLFLLMETPKPPRFIDGKEVPITGELYRANQLEIPISTLPWLVDLIENRFWVKPSDGGLANDVLHVNEIVDDVDLVLRFTPNCKAEAVQGFTLKNYSKPDTQRGDNYTYMDLPYSLLRDGDLLQAWKDIIKQLSLPFIQGVPFKN